MTVKKYSSLTDKKICIKLTNPYSNPVQEDLINFNCTENICNVDILKSTFKETPFCNIAPFSKNTAEEITLTPKPQQSSFHRGASSITQNAGSAFSKATVILPIK